MFWKTSLKTWHRMTKKFKLYQKLCIQVDFCTTFLFICRTSTSLYFFIKSAILSKISLFAIKDLLFYPFELHIFPSLMYSQATISGRSGVEICSCCKNLAGYLQIYWGRIFAGIFGFFYTHTQCILVTLWESIWILAKSSRGESLWGYILAKLLALKILLTTKTKFKQPKSLSFCDTDPWFCSCCNTVLWI